MSITLPLPLLLFFCTARAYTTSDQHSLCLWLTHISSHQRFASCNLVQFVTGTISSIIIIPWNQKVPQAHVVIGMMHLSLPTSIFHGLEAKSLNQTFASNPSLNGYFLDVLTQFTSTSTRALPRICLFSIQV